MKVPRNDLGGSHGQQELEWACSCPECTRDTEGHSALTLIGHDQGYHTAHDLHGPHSIMMVGMTPCPAHGCHMAFPFGADLGGHIHQAHPGQKLGISQVMMVIIPVPDSIHDIVHEAYEIPGHGAQRGKKRSDSHDVHSTNHTAVKTHARGSRSIHTKEPHNHLLDHPRTPESTQESHHNSPTYHDNHSQYHEDEGSEEDHRIFTPPSPGSPQFPEHGNEFTTYDHEDFQHLGQALGGPQQRLSQGHTQNEFYHPVAIPHHTDTSGAHRFKKRECAGCHEDPGESMQKHIEKASHHRAIFSCWHCGAYFMKDNTHLVKHVHKMHVAVDVNEKIPCGLPQQCHQTFHNQCHRDQHMAVEHRWPWPGNSQNPGNHGSKDHDKSHGPDNSHGNGNGKDHSQFGNANGHEKDSHAHDIGKDHSKADGEAKETHGHEKGKDHDGSTAFGQGKGHSKSDSFEKDSPGQEKGKDHAISDAHEKGSQAHAKDNSHEKADQGHAMGKDHPKDKDHAKEQDYSKAQEPHDHTKTQDHGKEDHAKGKDHTKEKDHAPENDHAKAKDHGKDQDHHLKGEDHAKGHNHVEDEWTDEEKSGKKKTKAKPVKKDKKLIVIPKRRIGAKAKKPISFRTGFSKAKKKL